MHLLHYCRTWCHANCCHYHLCSSVIHVCNSRCEVRWYLYVYCRWVAMSSKVLIALVFLYVWVICFFQVQKTLSMHLRSEESWGSKLHRSTWLKVWRAERRKCAHWHKHRYQVPGEWRRRSIVPAHSKLSIALNVVSMHHMQLYTRLCAAESSSHWK